MNAFLTLTGIETLHLRMDRHVQNALSVAKFLADHPRVTWVSYAGLKESPFHELALKYVPKGAGAVFTLASRAATRPGSSWWKMHSSSHTSPISATRAA